MPKGTPNQIYTGEFKQIVVEDIINNKLSYCEAARKYELGNHSIPQRWERIYLEEGAEGLYIERRGRVCYAGGTRKGKPPKLDKKIEEDLLAEVQRLRIENERLAKVENSTRVQNQMPCTVFDEIRGNVCTRLYFAGNQRNG